MVTCCALNNGCVAGGRCGAVVPRHRVGDSVPQLKVLDCRIQYLPCWIAAVMIMRLRILGTPGQGYSARTSSWFALWRDSCSLRLRIGM